MNKGIGMDGFQEIMPMGDDDTLIAVDDLNDSLSPECLLNEQMKDILIFDELDLPPAEVASLAMAAPMEIGEVEGDMTLEPDGGQVPASTCSRRGSPTYRCHSLHRNRRTAPICAADVCHPPRV